MQPISPQPGSAANPATFVGRRATTRLAREALLDGIRLSLTDPRRMGKTYWMKYFCATTTDFAPVFIDYEGVRSAEEFMLRTAERLSRERSVPTRAKDLLKVLFDHVELSAGPIKVRPGMRSMAPTQLLADIVLAVNDHAGQQPVLLCLDEVTLAIRNITNNDGAQTAREVLQTLRELQSNAERIRWIVCGSVGFHHVLRQCQATEGDINELNNLALGPLPVDEGSELAERLLMGTGRGYMPAAVPALMEGTGGIPYLMHKVASLMQYRAGAVSPGEVDQAVADFIADRDEPGGYALPDPTRPELRHRCIGGGQDPGQSRNGTGFDANR